MKFLAFTIFIVASVSARGSGPYLPSGWRPKGPAFYLPSEVEKPSESPFPDVLLVGSEASGTEELREYGPPKLEELPRNVLNQGLPDVEIEQSFIRVAPLVDDVKEVSIDSTNEVDGNQLVKEVVSVTEKETVDQQEAEAVVLKSDETTESKTEESITLDGQLDSIKDSITNVEEKSDFTTEPNAAVVQIQEEINERSAAGDKAVEAEIDIIEEVTAQPTEAARIADIALVDNISSELLSVNEDTTSSSYKTVQETQTSSNLQEEAVVLSSEQSQTSDESNESEVTHSEVKEAISNIELKIEAIEKSAESEVKKLEEVAQNIPQILTNLDNKDENPASVDASVLEASGSLVQVPEGFLEYGPPGFSEYGPPKIDQIAREAAQGKSLDLEEIITNETRRRRFSPKFKPTKKH